MDLAIEIIKQQIRFYDFKVRDFQPYFGATKESTENRLNELKNTLEQLKRVLEIISHENSSLNIADVTGSFNLNIIRQWFDAVEDLNPGYLQKSDYKLAKDIYEKLNMPVPKSVSRNCR